ncbi:shikimate dehydrogenase family protein [Microbacterium fluvii]|uniref:Shikimate dehydrogenase family protein n=1 Tax=Microbacterium fluvii TaxID=415215 RepID=A0ABW2HF42_9MICO|nr:shikimate dehydrogenase [Microbacterium fluvii]MCU4672017.1 shikimate dehydrogenase [Microbacterium fluvii]
MLTGTRLAVWGDPIAHSLSPVLHGAAYRVLGLDWTYERRQVPESLFDEFLAGLDESWRGLSCTMPLKAAAFAASAERDRRAELTGAVNTLLLEPAGIRGFNTDVGGIVRSLREEGVDRVDDARIVGAGATAASALVALAELGATHVEVVARRPLAVAPLEELGDRLGVVVLPVPFDAAGHAAMPVTIAALPGGARVAPASVEALRDAGGLLVDVVYGHWPTALSAAWEDAGLRAVSGLGMLLHQALLQVRVFVGGDVEAPLAGEDVILAAMREALAGPVGG